MSDISSVDKGKLLEKAGRKATGLNLDLKRWQQGCLPHRWVFANLPDLFQASPSIVCLLIIYKIKMAFPGNVPRHKGGIDMMQTINSNLAALKAYGKKMEVHANNVANLNSEGFRKSRTIITEGPGQSVSVSTERIDSPIRAVPDTDDVQTVQMDSNNVDLAEEIVGVEIAQTGYDANLALIKAEDEMVGTALDIVG